MPTYLTVAQLKARVGGEQIYVKLTSDDGGRTPDPTVATLLLDQVEAFTEGYARRGGYTIPLVATDFPLLVPSMLDIANYRAKTRRGTASKDDKQLYDEAIKLLERVADGDFVLPSGTGTTTSAVFSMTSDQQLFNRSRLRDF